MIGWPRAHHRRIDSTNRRAKQLAAAGAPAGTLVTAGEQTAGRGRQGRSWVAPAGRALLMSAVIRPPEPPGAPPALATAVAVCEAIEARAPVSCRVKWPNDIWIAGRKVAGILIEGRPGDGWTVIGIGLNVAIEDQQFPPELRGRATSLATAVHRRPAPTVEQMLAATLLELDRWLAAPAGAVLDAWRRRDALLARAVRWAGGTGRAEGIDGSGALIVATAAGEVRLEAGEVHLDGHDPTPDA